MMHWTSPYRYAPHPPPHTHKHTDVETCKHVQFGLHHTGTLRTCSTLTSLYKDPLPPDMFKLLHYKVCTASKWVGGILLECYLVLTLSSYAKSHSTRKHSSRMRIACLVTATGLRGWVSQVPCPKEGMGTHMDIPTSPLDIPPPPPRKRDLVSGIPTPSPRTYPPLPLDIPKPLKGYGRRDTATPEGTWD